MHVLKQLIEGDPRLTTRFSTERFGYVHATVEILLKGLGKTWIYGVCMPHELHCVHSNLWLTLV